MDIFKYAAATVITVMIMIACQGSGDQKQQESSQPESQVATDPQPAATPEIAEAGKKVYDQYCLVCHQADGKGVPNAFPPLIQTEWVNGDKETLIGVVLNGLTGPIEVNGESYNGAMIAHNFLSDDDVADVLTYVRSNFGNNASAITASEVAAVRAAQ